MCIAANKADVEDHREVTEEDLKAFGEEVKCDYVLTSAYQLRGIDVASSHQEAFKKVIASMQKKAKAAAKPKEKTKAAGEILVGNTLDTGDESDIERKQKKESGCRC